MTYFAIGCVIFAIGYLYGLYHGLQHPQFTEAQYREMTADWEDLS